MSAMSAEGGPPRPPHRPPARTALYARKELRAEPVAPPSRSGALSRTTAAARSSIQPRPGPAPTPGDLGLLRCRAGGFTLLLQVGSLLNVDRPAERPDETGLRVIDLRERLGAARGPGQSLLFLPGPERDPVELMVDPGVELVRADLSRVHPWPELLAGLPALRGLAALVELDDGRLGFLVDPHQLVG